LMHLYVTEPENILMDSDMTIKIADLALSKDPNATKTSALVGTPGTNICNVFDLVLTVSWILYMPQAYMAPELLRDGVVRNESDVWAFGVIAFECICQQRVYKDMRPMTLMQKIANEGLKPVFDKELKEDQTRPEWLPKGLIPIIESCLATDPQERPSFKSICNKLKQL